MLVLAMHTEYEEDQALYFGISIRPSIHILLRFKPKYYIINPSIRCKNFSANKNVYVFLSWFDFAGYQQNKPQASLMICAVTNA